MIDTHCHLNDDSFIGEVDNIIDNFLSAGIKCAICVGCDNLSNLKAKEIAEKNDNVYFSIGIHPENPNEYSRDVLENLIKASNDKLVAIGEVGLDYHFGDVNKEKQKENLIDQIVLANKYNLPVIIHCRDAYGDMLDILKAHKINAGFVFHCYSGSLEFAREIFRLGGFLSFTGNVTYKNSKNIQNVAKNIPDEKFFVETDSPYLSPEKFRGIRNEPKNVREVLSFIASLRETDEKELEKIVDKNAKLFFRIKD